jgi:hypothetical protein
MPSAQRGSGSEVCGVSSAQTQESKILAALAHVWSAVNRTEHLQLVDLASIKRDCLAAGFSPQQDLLSPEQVVAFAWIVMRHGVSIFPQKIALELGVNAHAASVPSQPRPEALPQSEIDAYRTYLTYARELASDLCQSAYGHLEICHLPITTTYAALGVIANLPVFDDTDGLLKQLTEDDDEDGDKNRSAPSRGKRVRRLEDVCAAFFAVCELRLDRAAKGDAV